MRRDTLRITRSLTALLVASAGAAFGPGAFAQDALGSGRALDANLQQGGSRVNPLGRNANIAQEVRFRNAIVTGNAPGGLSFRGDAGYIAADDFRANTGENTLYDFQRDSLYSGLATRGIRNIDALRSQMSLTTGGAPTFDSGGLFIQRAGAGASVADLRTAQPQLSIDPFTTRFGSLRSTASFVSAQSIEPQFFGTTQDQNGTPYAIGSSPLRGVIAQPLLANPEAAVAPLPELPGSSVVPTQQPAGAGSPQTSATPNAAAPGGLTFRPGDLGSEEPRERRPGEVGQTPANNRISDAVDPAFLGTNVISNRAPTRSAYDQIIQDFTTPIPVEPAPDAAPDQPAAANAPTTAETRTFLERVEDLRREILGLPSREEEAAANAEEGGAEALEVIDPETGEVIPQPARSEALRSVRDRAAETFGEAAAPTLDSLVPTGADPTVYNRYLRDAEAMLRAERWFDAEEAFTRAINRRPGDPIASAGRVSAQLGASMYLSASVNLRALFASHPEMAAVRFREGLFLQGNRLEQVIIYLRDEAQKDRPFGRDAALLLAYIGYQTGNTRDVRNAFADYDRNAMNLGHAPDPLVEMLKGAWLDAPERRAGNR
jgi:hypothetical protein